MWGLENLGLLSAIGGRTGGGSGDRSEVECAVGNLADGAHKQRAFLLLDALVQVGLSLALAHGDNGLPEHRPGVNALVDDVYGNAGLGCARGERVAHRVGAWEERQQSGVGIDESRRELAYEPGGQNAHQASAHDEVGAVALDPGRERGPPLSAVRVVGWANNEARDPGSLRIREARSGGVGSDADDLCGKLGVARCVNECFEIATATGDENREFQHQPSLPAVPVCGRATGPRAQGARRYASHMLLQDLFGLSGRTALVTGGSSGIGRAIAEALAGAGAHVVIAARTIGELEQAAEEIGASTAVTAGGGSASWVRADLATRTGAHELADALLDSAAGPGQIDIVVNSAGVNIRPPLSDLTEPEWDTTMAVNLEAPFVLGQRLAPGMVERGYGRLIHISSQQAHRPFASSGAYGVSKAAVEGLARSQAEAWSASGVTANALIPGFVQTPLNTRLSFDPAMVAALAARTLVGRNGLPEDFAGAAIFLASPAAAYVTGQAIAVDGGFSVH